MMALGFLVVALFLLAAPLAVPMAKLPGPVLSLGYVGLPLLLGTMALLPPGGKPTARAKWSILSTVCSSSCCWRC